MDTAEMHNSKPAYKVKVLLYLILAAGLGVLIYILLHETGNMIVMLSVGAKIESFSIFTAHVTASGGNYSEMSELRLHMNGAVIPIMCTYVYAMLYKKESKNLFYIFMSYIIALIPIGSLFAWVFVPFVYLDGSAPAADDVAKFLDIFSKEYSPLIVSAVAVLFMVIGIFIMIRKKILYYFFIVLKDLGGRRDA